MGDIGEINGNNIYGQDLLLGPIDNNDNDQRSEDLKAPIQCLRPSTLNMLSTMLNPIKIIPTETGIARDWRGLAELIGLTSESITFLQSRPDPTSELLKLWSTSSGSATTTTVMHTKDVSVLLTFLGVIDRFDIVEDTEQLIESDITVYKARLQNHSMSADSRIVPEPDSSTEKELITYDDQRVGNGKTVRYDAFILYSEEDSPFAMDIVEKMEKEHNLKMCVKERDLLPGAMFEHEVIGRLIEERCNRLLVVFSPSFLQSSANQFLVSYTQALAIESRHRKIIPLIYEECTLPPSVRFSFPLRFNRNSNSTLYNFWDKLRQSLSTSSAPPSSSKALLSTGSLASRSFEAQNPQPSKLNYGTSLPSDDISWWEPNKTPHHPPLSTSYSDSGFSKESISDDNFSLRSVDPLLLGSDSKMLGGTSTKPKSKKWIKKILNPMKKKHKEPAQAEAL